MSRAPHRANPALARDCMARLAVEARALRQPELDDPRGRANVAGWVTRRAAAGDVPDGLGGAQLHALGASRRNDPSATPTQRDARRPQTPGHGGSQ